jgi:hypothetical protein
VADAERGTLVSAALARIDIANVTSRKEEPRSYIGASSVGDDCAAYHALSLRGFPSNELTARQIRIFDDGHRLEEKVVGMLKAAGLTVDEIDPATGKQWAFSTRGGHVRAHLDGLVDLGDGVRRVLEVKSMNDKRFNALVKHGVKSSDPKYYSQMQLCMGLSGVHSGALVAYNKNTAAIHIELVDFDEVHWSRLFTRISPVLGGFSRRITSYRDAFTCTGCFKRDACWNGREPQQVDCKHCAHSLPVTSESSDRKWFCVKHDKSADAVCQDFSMFKVR